MTTYLDSSATSPVLKPVADLVYKFMVEEYGNSGSRTHEFGVDAKKAVERARVQVANVVGADKSEVVFTSGATESNNLAILGLLQFGIEKNRKHIITTKIEHKAVLEPIEYLVKKGFEVSYVEVSQSGVIDPLDVKKLLRDDTLLVSIMHVNNETGCIQPMADICNVLDSSNAYFHVDAAQSFGKLSEVLFSKRIDLISASGHKVYAPKGVGALIMRKRGFASPPLMPLQFGGGQEKGLRPGTLPVQLIAGFGLACELASKNGSQWQQHACSLKKSLIHVLDEFGAEYNGQNSSPFILNFSIPGVNSEAAMIVLKGIVAVSNGSACTSNSYAPSYVLTSMGLSKERIGGAIRMSWSHMTDTIPLGKIREQLNQLRL